VLFLILHNNTQSQPYITHALGLFQLKSGG